MNSTIGTKRRLVADQPLWVILLAMLGTWKLVKWPIGWLAAMTIGVYWAVKNKEFIRWWVQQLHCRLIFWLNGIQDRSLWFEQEGREQILSLVERLSAEGRSYCDLAKELELPAYSHWHAISKGLNELGILSQMTNTSFYILWKLPDKTV